MTLTALHTFIRASAVPFTRICVLCLSAAALLPATTAAANRIEAVAAEFEQSFRHAFAENGYPGAAAAIVTRDAEVLTITLGHTDLSRSARVDTDTVFRLASVSKTFAAGTVALLTREGKLGWDDPVIRYVPELRVNGNAGLIQLRHLLEHSSGLVPHAYDNLIEDGVENQRILQKLSELPYVCRPGQCYGYQNFLFSLLEPAVAKAGAMPYPELVRQRIFTPLDMRTASVGYEAFIGNPNRAEPHVRSRGGWKTVTVEPNYYHVAAAAGVNASISDLAKWLRAQLGSHPDVIPPDIVETVTAPRLRTRRELYRKHWRDLLTDAHYGLGWRIYELGERRIVYHGGWVRGYRADLAWSPDLGVGIAILLNVEGNSISELSAGFWSLAMDRLTAPDPVLPAGP